MSWIQFFCMSETVVLYSQKAKNKQMKNTKKTRLKPKIQMSYKKVTPPAQKTKNTKKNRKKQCLVQNSYFLVLMECLVQNRWKPNQFDQKHTKMTNVSFKIKVLAKTISFYMQINRSELRILHQNFKIMRCLVQICSLSQNHRYSRWKLLKWCSCDGGKNECFSKNALFVRKWCKFQ